MKNIEELLYNKNLLINTFYDQEIIQKIYLSKSFFKELQKDQYFLKIYELIEGKIINQGYIYFYLDNLKKESQMIGMYVKPEYRHKGLASLLIASWITFCLNHNIENLITYKRQRKPFILFLLKRFSFELNDKNQYLISPDTIYICQKENSQIKYLLFKNSKHKLNFQKGKIIQQDNYEILDCFNPNIPVLDQVMLSSIYYGQNNNLAYSKSEEVIKRIRTKNN